LATYGNMIITQAGQTLYGKVQTGTALQFTRFQIGGGELVTSATLSAALTSGATYTSLSVSALSAEVLSGSSIVIGSGATTQTVTASAQAASGATSIPVASFTANANYTVGTSLAITENEASLTALISPIDYFNINSISDTSNTAVIRGVYQNTKLTTSTYTCEIGLFAQDPTAGEILYAYANANANGDTIPPYADGPFSRQFQINTAVGNATSVTANIPSDTYILATAEGAANGVATLDANKNVVQTKPVVSDVFGSTSVVLSGAVATKDATTATQLDVTAAILYFASGDRISFPSATFATATASTTYYLDYNPDGTTSWGTAHSTQTGYVPIAQVTTDASGNVSAVTDERPTTVGFFHSATAVDGSKMVNLPIPPVVAATTTALGTVEISVAPVSGNPVAVSTADSQWENFTGNPGRFIVSNVDGGNNLWFGTGKTSEPSDLALGWQTDASGNVVGLQFAHPVLQVAGQTTAGSFGVSATLTSAKNVEVTSTAAQTILTFMPTTSGLYSIKSYLRVVTAATTVTLTIAFADSGGAQPYTPPALNAQSLAVGSHGVIAYDFEAVAGTPITLTVTAGTANQVYVTGALVGVA